MTAPAREQWGTRAGFLLAAIGSAIGLGNIWRFPYVAYENGGGAFLVPYLVALLSAGIPLLIFEYTIGHKFRGSPPLAFRRMARAAEPIGWWQVAISFVIAVYYAVIIAWAMRYVGFSVGQQWGADPETFFFEDFLHIAEQPGFAAPFVPGVLWPLIAVWAVTLIVLALGIRRGIEIASKIFIPLLIVLFVILVVRALFLPGALDGLNAFFSPDWSSITDGKVWVAAYGQIFFSLSVGFGIMVTYASYLRRKADLSGSAMVAGFANSSFEILAGIGVFATLGFMAHQTGVAVSEVSTSGPGLAFVAFPTIISELSAGAAWFGILFFTCLVLAGLSSLISIVQVIVSSVQDRTGLARVPAVLIIGGFTAVVSIALFPTRNGLYLLDVADHFINQYGIVLAAFVAVVLVAWILRKLGMLKLHTDSVSSLKVGPVWVILLGVITPVVLVWMMIDSLRQEFDENYGGYTTSYVLAAGWGVAGVAILFGVLMSLLPWKQPGTPDDEDGTPAVPVTEEAKS
ncbi:sodium-dependent transporter [Nocardia mangyaensis]|uniref:sodium-dependent transporter n=1 Tax=Nocardia mangyaensis TaxID=2213200 RepID=UPI002677526C|nr:sodium-dependent transporter [Nocardia mangyaensis]MDO3645783.1 sodium-dependent transporter [Nocardia mangyaensis]